MLPSVAQVACDCHAVIIGVSTQAAYLAVILLRAVQDRYAMTVMDDRTVEWRRRWCIVVTGDSRNREGGVCHAIASQKVRFEGWFR